MMLACSLTLARPGMENGFRSGEWGWIQDSLERNGGCCLAGAMGKVKGIRYRDMERFLASLLPPFERTLAM